MSERIEVRREGIGLRIGFYAAAGVAVGVWSLSRVPLAADSQWEWAAVILGFGVAALSLFGLRAKVVIEADSVSIVNPFRTVTVATQQVRRVEVGFAWRHWAYVATLVTGDGVTGDRRRVVMWALSGWPPGLTAESATTALHAAHVAALLGVDCDT